MATDIQDIDGVSITQFCLCPGRVAFQVTWRSSDPNQLFDFVEFDDVFEADAFAQLLRKRLVR
jgi:hypothetical protein